jgi:phosphate starvation-inducible membrane PsiE
MPEFRREVHMKPKWALSIRKNLNEYADGAGVLLVDAFHYLALFAIGATIVWSAATAFVAMAAAKGHASIDDILLLFIYLELGAMVGIYFKTNHMPVRFLIYVGMTALTRLLISDVQDHHRPGMEVIYVTAAILLLALATLTVRFGSAKFPSTAGDEAAKK